MIHEGDTILDRAARLTSASTTKWHFLPAATSIALSFGALLKQMSNTDSRRASLKHRSNDEEGSTWSIGSNDGVSRSSLDFPREKSSDTLLNSAPSQLEEYIQLLTTNDDYFYDGLEEILVRSTDEEIHLDDHDDRMSFTREQLLEYQQLTKLLRFVKVRGEREGTDERIFVCLEWRSMHDDSRLGLAARSPSARSMCLPRPERFLHRPRTAQFPGDVRSGSESKTSSSGLGAARGV